MAATLLINLQLARDRCALRISVSRKRKSSPGGKYSDFWLSLFFRLHPCRKYDPELALLEDLSPVTAARLSWIFTSVPCTSCPDFKGIFDTPLIAESSINKAISSHGGRHPPHWALDKIHRITLDRACQIKHPMMVSSMAIRPTNVRGTSWRTLLVLGRVSNLPTVWSNVLLGLMLCAPAAEAWQRVINCAPIFLGASLLYLFGMYANDWKDASWDAKHGKDRPIPRGEIDRANVAFLSLFLLFSGLSSTWRGGIWTVALVASISLYTLIHKKTPLAIIPMAACRFFLVLMAADACGEDLPWIAASSLAIYLLALTLAARSEHKKNNKALISLMLAGICLHDALWLLSGGYWIASLTCVAAFLLCRLMQKYIPAT